MQNRLVELHRFLHAHESSPLDSGIAFLGMYFRLAEETALVTLKLSYAETIVFSDLIWGNSTSAYARKFPHRSFVSQVNNLFKPQDTRQ
jgi:hypothetical protein